MLSQIYDQAGCPLQQRLLLTGAAVYGQVIVLSLLTASISFTVTESKIFKHLREWVRGKHALAGEMVSCGYCFGHWVSFVLVALYPVRLLERWWVLDYLFTALIIAWLAGFQWVGMCWLFQKAGK